MLVYIPETGEFFWKWRDDRPEYWNRRFADRIAGRRDPGRYNSICINYRSYYAHHVAWAWMTGRWSDVEIDHRDGDFSNNRWGNLREATSRQNKQNARGRRTSHTGVKGVSYETKSGRYYARITVGRVTTRLGNFDTIEEAQAAFEAAALKLHGAFARTK